jgi:hypothetical protein
MKTFSPRLYYRNLWIFYAGGLFFTAVLFLPGDWQESGRSIAAWFLVIWFLSLLILSFRPGSKYVIDNEGIYFTSFWIHKKFIAYKDLAHLQKLTHSEVKKYTDKQWVQSILVEQAKDPKRSYKPTVQEAVSELKSRYKYNQFLAYCTANIVVKVASNGAKSYTTGDFILVTNMSGEQYLISPKDVVGFIQEAVARSPFSITNS